MSQLVKKIYKTKKCKPIVTIVIGLIVLILGTSVGLPNKGTSSAQSNPIGGSLNISPSSGTYNIGDTIDLKLSISNINFSSSTGYYISDLALAQASGTSMSYVGSTCNNSLYSCTINTYTQSGYVYVNAIFTSAYLNSNPTVYLATLNFKITASGTAKPTFSTNWPPKICSDLPYHGCQDGPYSLSYSIPSYIVRVSCSPIDGGQKCSDGSIRCNSGYHQSGTTCQQDAPPPPPVQGGSGGGGNPPPVQGGGSGSVKTPVQGATKPSSTKPTGGSASTAIQGASNQPSQTDEQVVASSSEPNDTSSSEVTYQEVTPSNNHIINASQSDIASILPDPESKGSPTATFGILGVLVLAAGVTTIFIVAKRKRLALADTIDPDMLASVASHAPYDQTSLTQLTDSPMTDKINEAFYPQQRHQAPKAVNNPDEPEDMFELAHDHPELYGASAQNPNIANSPSPAQLEDQVKDLPNTTPPLQQVPVSKKAKQVANPADKPEDSTTLNNNKSTDEVDNNGTITINHNEPSD